jgi:hypothetical protein
MSPPQVRTTCGARVSRKDVGFVTRLKLGILESKLNHLYRFMDILVDPNSKEIAWERGYYETPAERLRLPPEWQRPAIRQFNLELEAALLTQTPAIHRFSGDRQEAYVRLRLCDMGFETEQLVRKNNTNTRMGTGDPFRERIGRCGHMQHTLTWPRYLDRMARIHIKSPMCLVTSRMSRGTDEPAAFGSERWYASYYHPDNMIVRKFGPYGKRSDLIKIASQE